MKVYAYPRVSTDEQADKGNSINEQMERMTAYCKAMGWDEPIFFIENGYSAKNLNRPELTKLLDCVKKGEEGGIVLTTKLDRLSRKLFDILSLNDFFNKHNFNYVSATEGFDTSTPAGRLVLQMLGMVAEFERERISERVRDNMLSLAKNTKKVLSRPCYGYNVVDKEMIINIEESLNVKKMAEWAIEGKGAREIAKRLNLEGVKTKEGNLWHEKIVRDLLQRDTLIGDFTYNKTYKKGTKIVQRPEEEWVRIPDHHDPILDKHTFEKMKELFRGRKTVGRHISNDKYLLSGLVYCSHCGSKMNGKMNKNFSKRENKENIHYRYMCDGYLKKGICYYHAAKRDELEALILDRAIQLSNSAAGDLNLSITTKITPKDEKGKLLTQLDRIEKKIQKQIDAYNDDLITAHDLKIASDRAKKEREAIKIMLDEINNNNTDRSEQDLIEKAKRKQNDLLSDDRLKKKYAIRELVDKIQIKHGEEVEIIWRGF